MNPKHSNAVEKVNVVSDRQRGVYNFSLLTVFMVLALGIGAVKPSVETIIRINSEIKQKKVVLEQLDNKINSLNALSLEYKKFERTAKDLHLVFPTNGDFSLFLANIEYLTRSSGFELNSVGFSPDSGNNALGPTFQTLQPVSVSLSVRGNRSNIMQLLQMLESLPMYPVVQSLSFSNEVDEEGKTDYSLSLTIYEIPTEKFYK